MAENQGHPDKQALQQYVHKYNIWKRSMLNNREQLMQKIAAADNAVLGDVIERYVPPEGDGTMSAISTSCSELYERVICSSKELVKEISLERHPDACEKTFLLIELALGIYELINVIKVISNLQLDSSHLTSRLASFNKSISQLKEIYPHIHYKMWYRELVKDSGVLTDCLESNIKKNVKDTDSSKALEILNQAELNLPLAELEKTYTPDDSFKDFDLKLELLKAIYEIGWIKATALQRAFIPFTLLGRDILAQAIAGDGKTGAYVIPILQQIEITDDYTQALVMVDTKEKAMRTSEMFESLSKYIDAKIAICTSGIKLRIKQNRNMRRPIYLLELLGK